ncbi:amino acid transporter [Acephala macrosclerotiorum]|nr:amino acid transporter [Acephala macrosclerotiorum]
MAPPQLKQTLRGFQVFFIVISGIIGGGVFNNNGEALEVAGPAGLILSVVVIGLIAIFVSEGISELSQKFPAPNAIVEYVKTFVDEDLGWVVGIAYWYAFASVFAVQDLVAAQLSTYWGLTQTWQTLAFYVLAPVVIVTLNFFGVYWYGIVETVGGALKVILVLGVSILLYVIAAQQGDGKSSGPINDGFKNNATFADNRSEAVCYAIPLVAYGFLGIEIVAVTAFEAQYSSSLKLPSQVIAYAIFVLYFLCTIGETLTVRWTNNHLPKIYGGGKNNAGNVSWPSSTSMIVEATWAAGHKSIAGFLNGCMIFSVLSSSNTSLYVSSRTLYGLARDIPDTNWFGKKLKGLSIVVRQTGVPAMALLFSAVLSFWLPFLQLKAGYAIQDLIEIMAVSASVSCLVVWAALCLAFIRYERWLELCDDKLKLIPQHEHYRRASENYKAYAFIGSWGQPYVAWLGLIGCFLVFGFTSATWWSTKADLTKVAVAYAAHVIFFLLFVVFKLFNQRWWVRLNPDVTVLVGELNRLTWLKQDQKPKIEEQRMHDLAAQAAPPQSSVGRSDVGVLQQNANNA